MPESKVENTSLKDFFEDIFKRNNNLLKEKRWVCCKDENNIINPEDEMVAYSDNPHTWGSFSAACHYIDSHEGYTLGMQLGRNSGLSAVHISNCINSDGTITNDQQVNELVRYCTSYIEYDLSGKGLTFLLSENDIMPYEPYVKKLGKIEIKLYDHYQCIPLTGKAHEIAYFNEKKSLGNDLITRGTEFINAIYKWMSERFSGKEDRPSDYEILPDIEEINGVRDFTMHQISNLIRNNLYFQNLWYNNIPADKGERHHDIDLVARIYSIVPYSHREINKIFKASPSFSAKSRETKLKFEGEIVDPKFMALIMEPGHKNKNTGTAKGDQSVSPLSSDSVKAYTRKKEISTTMENLIETAKKLNQDKNFMKYDNDVKLMRDEIYGDIIDLSNDKTCADIFLAAYGDKIKYCIDDNSWYVYDGSHWLSESNNALPHIRIYAEQLFERLNAVMNWYNIDYKEKKKLQRNINKFANVMPFKRILESARAKSVIQKSKFNSDPHKLSVGNGTIDLKTGKLEKHNPTDYITLHTDVNYYPNYCQPRMFLRFLNQIFKGDTKLINYFQRVMGYCITGDTAAQVFFVFCGDGRNGKSTLINILNGVLNEYAGQFDSYALALKNDGSGKANSLLIDNQSRRYVVVSEKNEGTELDVALIKAISGGDNISARRLFENNVTLKPTYKLIFVTNFLPTINWNDDAIIRRYRIIPFNAKFKEEDADPKLAEKIIAAEKEMILKWLVDGAKEYYINQYSLGEPPVAVTEAIIKARNEDKTVRATLYSYKEDRLIITTPGDESNIIQARELFLDYEQWCQETGHNKMTETAFGIKMPGILGTTKEKKKCIYYTGVKFKNSGSGSAKLQNSEEGKKVNDDTEEKHKKLLRVLHEPAKN